MFGLHTKVAADISSVISHNNSRMVVGHILLKEVEMPTLQLTDFTANVLSCRAAAVPCLHIQLASGAACIT